MMSSSIAINGYVIEVGIPKSTSRCDPYAAGVTSGVQTECSALFG